MWLQPVPGQEGALQGIDIGERGIATSVNMRTLIYKSWKLRNGKLTLSGMSVGNRQTLSFTETYDVHKLTEESLILKRGDETRVFRRSRPGKEK